MTLAPFAIAIAIVAVLSGAAASAADLTAQQQEGRRLFEATCNYCHNARGWATERLRLRVAESQAVLTERNDLDAAYVRFVVRNGLVNMPAYTPTDLSDEQIAAVAAFLTRDKSQ